MDATIRADVHLRYNTPLQIVQSKRTICPLIQLDCAILKNIKNAIDPSTL